MTLHPTGSIESSLACAQWRREGGGRGGQLPPGAGTRGAPAKANKKKARPTKQRENNDSIQV